MDSLRRSRESKRISRLGDTRPEIFTRMSCNALVLLSSPTMPVQARQAIEARVIAGEKIVAADIIRARGGLKAVRPRRRPGQLVRMAA